MLARGSAAGRGNPSTQLTIAISPNGDAQSAPHGKGNVYAPDVLYDNGLYRMWFGGQGRDGHDRIQLAESQDGVNWQPRGVVLEDPTANHVNDPSVVKRGDTYFMYYTRAATDILDEIALATSSDGLHWTKRDVVLQPSPAGNWDSLLVGRPSVIVDGDKFRMWYDGRKDLPPGALADNLKAAGSARSVRLRRILRRLPMASSAGNARLRRKRGRRRCRSHRQSLRNGLRKCGRHAASHQQRRDRVCPKGLFVPLSGSDLDRYGHVTPFLLVDDKTTLASLFIGAARNGRWDENVIARIDLTPANSEMLHAQ